MKSTHNEWAVLINLWKIRISPEVLKFWSMAEKDNKRDVRVQSFSHVWLFVTPWSLWGFFVRGILQVRILEWVAIFSSRGKFLTQGSSPCLLHCRQILYPWATGEAHRETLCSDFAVRSILTASQKGCPSWILKRLPLTKISPLDHSSVAFHSGDAKKKKPLLSHFTIPDESLGLLK